jgi:hypothetical protein
LLKSGISFADALWPDLIWHDGNLVDFKILGIQSHQTDLNMRLELYADRNPSTKRSKFNLLLRDLTKLTFLGDPAKLRKHSVSGNIDNVTNEWVKGGKSHEMSFLLFGGYILVAAKEFFLEPVEI